MRSAIALVLVLSSCALTPASPPTGWQPLETGSSASLRGISALSGGVVWASGSGGTVLKSLDAGATWQIFEVPGDEPNDLRDIEALDASRAFVISITQPARVLATRDGGESWQVLYTSPNPDSFFDSLALLEGGGVLVFGDPQEGVFEVLRDDGDGVFVPVPGAALPPAAEGEAAFAASGTCIVSHGSQHAWIGTGGKRARVLRSVDGGRSWDAAETPMRQGAQTTGIYSVAFRDERHGVIVGGDYTQPALAGDNAALSLDGGVTWLPADEPPHGYRSGVVWLPAFSNACIAVGRAGCDLSIDGGRTWQPFGGDSGYYAVSASPDGEIFAVGSEGRARHAPAGAERGAGYKNVNASALVRFSTA